MVKTQDPSERDSDSGRAEEVAGPGVGVAAMRFVNGVPHDEA